MRRRGSPRQHTLHVTGLNQECSKVLRFLYNRRDSDIEDIDLSTIILSLVAEKAGFQQAECHRSCRQNCVFPGNTRCAVDTGWDVYGNHGNALSIDPRHDLTERRPDIAGKTRPEDGVDDEIRFLPSGKKAAGISLDFEGSAMCPCKLEEDCEVRLCVTFQLPRRRKQNDLKGGTHVQEMPRDDQSVSPVVPLTTEHENVFSIQRSVVTCRDFCNSPPCLLHEQKAGYPVPADGGLITPPHFAC